jgi:hypothetical protein
VVVEAKRKATFEESYAQVLSEAATSQAVRLLESNKRKSIHAVMSDGEQWRFVRITENREVEATEPMVAWVRGVDLVQSADVGHVFRWLVFVLREAVKSSLRASTANLDLRLSLAEGVVDGGVGRDDEPMDLSEGDEGDY